jgi:uncharacterized protein (TIGR02453 family)
MSNTLTYDFIRFLHELEANNNREWFQTHKSRYELLVKQPFECMVDVLIDRLHQIEPRVILTPKDAIFRIYRDTRFSADKTPYKNHVSAVIGPGGRKNPNGQGLYLEISPQHIRMYAGAYMPDKAMLLEIRERIASDSGHFQSLYLNPEFVQYFCRIHGDKNKVLPGDLKDAAQLEPLIFNKQFYFYTDWTPSDIVRPDLIDDIVDRYRVARPLLLFLTD